MQLELKVMNPSQRLCVYGSDGRGMGDQLIADIWPEHCGGVLNGLVQGWLPKGRVSIGGVRFSDSPRGPVYSETAMEWEKGEMNVRHT